MTTAVPERFVAGDALEFYDDGAQFPPADGWVLSIAFVATGAQVKATASNNGDGRHKFSIASSASDDLPVGAASWQLYATKSGNRQTIGTGVAQVLANFDTATGGLDARSTAIKTLEAIEATIQRRASKDQESYQIDGRALSRTPLPDLIALRDRYAAIVRREQKADRLRRGLGTNSTIRVRM